MQGINSFSVVASPLPFSNQQIKRFEPEGATLAQIIDGMIPGYKVGMVQALVTINGNPIYPELWHRVKPKANTLVNVRVVPTGGDGKNPLMTVLTIAVLIAAPYAAGYFATTAALGVFGGGVATAGQVALMKGVLTATFSVLGQLAVQALAPPPKASTPATTNYSQTQFIEGARNNGNPYGVVPVCLGTNRMVPFLAARNFTESVGSDQYVRQLFTWGFGDHVEVTDFQIGDTSLSNFSDYELEHALDGNLHEGTELYANDVFEEPTSVTLTQAAGWIQRTVQPTSDEVILDVTFPSGLLRTDNPKGWLVYMVVSFEIEYRAVGDVAWTLHSTPSVEGTAPETIRKSYRIVFPQNGDYEVRIRRLTEDYSTTSVVDTSILSAIRSIEYTSPVVMQGLNGTAIRIKATDQLNGAVDQLSGLVSNHILNFNPDSSGGTWVREATSNPASIYRYVLQGPVNKRPLADDRVDIEALEAWHQYCEERGYTYNRVIDYETSVDELLRDIASAGSASPDVVDGKRTVVVDRAKDDITQMVTPRNSWGYTASMTYPNLPHAMRVTFRNSEKGYAQDERIVYNDGYDESNATIFETLDIQSCTNPILAYKVARRMFAQAKLRPETHTFNMDVENLVSLRGDRIKFEHDVPMLGVGDARIKALELDSSLDTTGVALDDTIAIPQAGRYFMRIRKADGTQLYEEVLATVGYMTNFDFVNPIAAVDSPAAGDLVMVSLAGGEHDLLITRIEPGPDLTARITCIDYAPAVFDAETGTIPRWNSNITTPLDMQRPLSPILVNAQSDEGVMLLNPDGSLTSRAVFTLENPNDSDMMVSVRIRPTGDTQFMNANVLEARPERVMLTGLEDGMRYDIFIYYQRVGGSVFSNPLQINSYLFEGASGLPADVQNFRITINGDVAMLRWDKNTEIDISHYVIRFSSLFSGATWGNSQLLQDNIYENNITLPFQPGTYFIKAVDRTGNMSENAATIITYDPGLITNAVEILQENPDFLGVKDNVYAGNNGIVLADPNIPVGYYYFANEIDLTGIFESFVSAQVVANGTFLNNVFDMTDVFAVDDVFGAGQNDVFAMTNMFEVDDVFGIGEGGWEVKLQYSRTNDDPSDSGADWSAWEDFVSGNIEFRAMRFRLEMRSLQAGISPLVSVLSVLIDMPDRIERGEDLTVPDTGTTITYEPAFKSNPAVAITLQDADEADEIQFVSKSSIGFEFKVYNRTSGTYVGRVYDFIASGYGRESN